MCRTDGPLGADVHMCQIERATCAHRRQRVAGTRPSACPRPRPAHRAACFFGLMTDWGCHPDFMISERDPNFYPFLSESVSAGVRGDQTAAGGGAASRPHRAAGRGRRAAAWAVAPDLRA